MTNYEDHPVFQKDSSSEIIDFADAIGKAVMVLNDLNTLISRGQKLTVEPNEVFIEPSGIRVAKRLVMERSAREKFFEPELCAEPVWDIIIDLFIAGARSQTVSVSSSCIASRIPPTTALRCLRALHERGIILRSFDQHDKRRIFLTLAPHIEEKMIAYLAWFGPKRQPSLESTVEARKTSSFQ